MVGWDGLHSLAAILPYARHILAVVLVLGRSITQMCELLLARCSSLRELALTFYDTRAIVVEVVARWVGMHDLAASPPYAQQLAALEGLQIYAPLGHGLGLRTLCAQLEDRCFQVCRRTSTHCAVGHQSM